MLLSLIRLASCGAGSGTFRRENNHKQIPSNLRISTEKYQRASDRNSQVAKSDSVCHDGGPLVKFKGNSQLKDPPSSSIPSAVSTSLPSCSKFRGSILVIPDASAEQVDLQQLQEERRLATTPSYETMSYISNPNHQQKV